MQPISSGLRRDHARHYVVQRMHQFDVWMPGESMVFEKRDNPLRKFVDMPAGQSNSYDGEKMFCDIWIFS